MTNQFVFTLYILFSPLVFQRTEAEIASSENFGMCQNLAKQLRENSCEKILPDLFDLPGIGKTSGGGLLGGLLGGLGLGGLRLDELGLGGLGLDGNGLLGLKNLLMVPLNVLEPILGGTNKAGTLKSLGIEDVPNLKEGLKSGKIDPSVVGTLMKKLGGGNGEQLKSFLGKLGMGGGGLNELLGSGIQGDLLGNLGGGLSGFLGLTDSVLVGLLQNVRLFGKFLDIDPELLDSLDAQDLWKLKKNVESGNIDKSSIEPIMIKFGDKYLQMFKMGFKNGNIDPSLKDAFKNILGDQDLQKLIKGFQSGNLDGNFLQKVKIDLGGPDTQKLVTGFKKMNSDPNFMGKLVGALGGSQTGQGTGQVNGSPSVKAGNGNYGSRSGEGEYNTNGQGRRGSGGFLGSLFNAAGNLLGGEKGQLGGGVSGKGSENGRLIDVPGGLVSGAMDTAKGLLGSGGSGKGQSGLGLLSGSNRGNGLNPTTGGKVQAQVPAGTGSGFSGAKNAVSGNINGQTAVSSYEDDYESYYEYSDEK